MCLMFDVVRYVGATGATINKKITEEVNKMDFIALTQPTKKKMHTQVNGIAE